MTLSPTATSSGTRLPLSSMRPGPIARTSPSWGFSLAVSGMTRPEAVGCSASTDLTTMRSSSGLMETDTVGPPLWDSRDADRGVLRLVQPPSTPPSRGSACLHGWHLRKASANENLGLRLALGQLECQNPPGRRVRKDGPHGCSNPGAPGLG